MRHHCEPVRCGRALLASNSAAALALVAGTMRSLTASRGTRLAAVRSWRNGSLRRASSPRASLTASRGARLAAMRSGEHGSLRCAASSQTMRRHCEPGYPARGRCAPGEQLGSLRSRSSLRSAGTCYRGSLSLAGDEAGDEAAELFAHLGVEALGAVETSAPSRVVACHVERALDRLRWRCCAPRPCSWSIGWPSRSPSSGDS
jgi:hypothetical protein